MYFNLLIFQPGYDRGDFLGAFGILGRGPDFTAVLGYMGCTIHRLRGGMGLIGQVVGRFHPVGGTFKTAINIPGGIKRFPLLCSHFSPAFKKAVRVDRRVAVLPPLDLQQLHGRFGLPECIRHDSNTGADRNDVSDARHGQRFLRIERFDFGPEYRWMDHGGESHSGDFDIDTELRTAVNLGSAVQT